MGDSCHSDPSAEGEEAQPQETAAKPATQPTTPKKTVVIRTSGATFPKYQIQKW
ncbi:MAG TPA: phosphate ABC transporter substrate-binding protein PstS, partial [Thiotrichaceae bacterium]|nr:phosphate ABC transporter substrate-binding protein PstS [Thiotrichaceae bacterium]